MDVLMDGLLMTATLFAGCYCWVLARRVRDLKSLDKGLGGAIVTLTRQVELARTTLEEARAASTGSRQELGEAIARADAAAGQLRLLLAAADDPRPARAPQSPRSAPRPEPRLTDRAAILVDEPGARAEETGEAEAGDADALGVPKPRALPPLENPLRRRLRDDAPPPRNEEEILAALSAMAASGGR